MLEDLTKEICDNGYCEIDSNFFTSKVEHDYNDDFYNEEVFDDECSEENCCEDFGIANIRPIFLNNKVKYSGYFTYSEPGKNLFNVLIKGLGNFKPEYIAEKVTELTFDENSIEICLFCDTNLATYLFNEANVDFGERDFRGGCIRNRKGGEIVIEQLDATGRIIMEYKFYNTTMSSVNCDGTSGEDNLYIRIGFGYDYFLTEVK